MEELDEIQTVHNEQIYKFVPMIAHKDIDTGAESVGSGVRIRYGYHHIIATAKHCMIDMPRIMSDKYVYHKDRNELESLRPVPIIDRWMHPSLDIGFLVTSEASGAEGEEDRRQKALKFFNLRAKNADDLQWQGEPISLAAIGDTSAGRALEFRFMITME